MFFEDLLAAIAVVINGLPQGLLSLSYGFGLFPTSLGFVAGVIGMLVFQQVAPISFQAESIVMAGVLGKNRNERLNIVFFTGVIMAIVGGLGLLNATIEFIGPAILNGMMAGVGIMLAKTGIVMIKENKIAGGISMATAILVYFLSNYNLIYTIVASVFISTIVHILVKNTHKNSPKDENSSENKLDLSHEKFEPLKFDFSPNVIRGTLALVTLQIGGNIAYASVTGSIANAAVDVDKITLYSGIGDAVSAFFGGGPVEAIISGTAAAPNPVRSGILMMAIMAVILLIKILPKIAKHVPNQSIAGFLFVLGAIVVFPDNALASITESPLVAGATTIVTAVTDPFIGMIAGLIVKFFVGL
ncbi:MAG: NCS2 family permease [Tissierellia bacterium]|nr:NCS2 family permease [Tissierellia bacterium]